LGSGMVGLCIGKHDFSLIIWYFRYKNRARFGKY
jgi:hypothetical protein